MLASLLLVLLCLPLMVTEAESDAIREIAAVFDVQSLTQIEAGCIGKVIDMTYGKRSDEPLLSMDHSEIRHLKALIIVCSNNPENFGVQ